MAILRTNVFVNPRCGKVVTNYTQIAGTGGTANTTRVTSAAGFFGAHIARTAWTVATSAVSGGIVAGAAASNAITTVPATVYHFSCYVRSNIAQRIGPEVRFFTSGAVQVGSPVIGTAVVLVANTWTRIDVSATAPATGVRAYLHANAVVGTGGVNWAVGNNLDMSNVLVEPAGSLDTYFDGTSKSGRWEGEDHNSRAFIDDAVKLSYVGKSGGQTHTTNTGTTTVNAAASTNYGNTPGNYAILIARCKPQTMDWVPDGVGAGAGWTLLADLTGGTGAFGVDTGPTRIKMWGKVVDNTGNFTLTATAAANSAVLTDVLFYVPNDYIGISAAGATGTDNTTGTPYSVTFSSDPGFTISDLYAVAHCFPTDIAPTYSADSLAVPSVTDNMWFIENPISGTGNDIGGRTSWGEILTGTSTGAAVLSYTLAGTTTNAAGPAAIVRLRGTIVRGVPQRRQVRQAVNRAGSF